MIRYFFFTENDFEYTNSLKYITNKNVKKLSTLTTENLRNLLNCQVCNEYRPMFNQRILRRNSCRIKIKNTVKFKGKN